MTQFNPYHGFGLPDLHWVDGTYLAANTGGSLVSSYTEADSVPGRVTPVAGQALVPVISNAQGDDPIVVRVRRSGYAGTAGLTYQIGASGSQIGWHGLRVMGYDFAPFLGGPPYAATSFSAVVVPSTQLYVLVYVDSGGALLSITRAPDGTWSAPVMIVSSSSATAAVQLYLTPDESRLIIARWASGSRRLSTYYSTDVAATWTILARQEDIRQLLPSSDDPGKCAGCFTGNDMVLWVHADGAPDRSYQYASADGGITWDLVESIASGVEHLTIARLDSSTAIVVYSADDPSTALLAGVLGSAYQSIPTVQAVTVDTLVAGAGLAVATDGGSAYLVAIEDDTDRYLYAYTSADRGLSWSARVVAFAAGTSDGPRNLSLAAQCGRLWLACRHTGGVDTTSMSHLALSGWSSHEFDIEPAHTWLPWDEPDASGWTHSGSEPFVIDVTGADFTPSAADGYYERGQVSSLTPGAHIILDVASGGALTDNSLVFGVIARTTLKTYNIRLRLTPTGFRVMDVVAGAEAATVTVDLTEPIEIVVGFRSESEGFVAYKRPGEVAWTEVDISATVFSDGGATGIAWSPQMGALVAGTSSSTWYQVVLYDDISAIVSGSGLTGRVVGGIPLALGPEAVDADDKVSHLSIRGGVGLRGQSYQIPPGHVYALENALVGVAPGSRKNWRSLDTSEQVIAIDLTGAEYSGSAFGVYFGRVNFRTAYLEYYNEGTASWQTVGTLDTATDFVDLEFDRSGGSIYPQSGASTSGRILQGNELADGGWVILTQGMDVAARYVCDHTGGWWQDRANTSAVLPVLNLDGVDDSEPETGLATLCARDAVLVVYPTTRIIARRWRIRIPSQPCPDEQFTAGNIFPIRLHAMSLPWSWGASGDEVSQYDSFRDTAGVESRSSRGDEIRTWTLSWSDGVPMRVPRQVAGGRHRVGAAGALPLEDEATVLFQLRSFFRATRGQTLPVVALSRLPTASGTINDRTLFLYGYLTGSVAHALAQGFESESELIRIEGVRVEGIP